MTARVRTDLSLVAAFLRNGGGPRAVMVALCTAAVSGLVLVALTVVLFTWESSREQEQVSDLVADGGVRGGYVLALLLICIAPLALLRQVVRLGTAAREQRLAALRLAGATTRDVRRLGALEVGLPALAGGFLGYPVFGVLRAVFGGLPMSQGGYHFAESEVARQLRLVPTTVQLSWWQVLLVALGVALLGVLAGARTSRSLVVSPLGVARRGPGSAPRPWAALLFVPAVVLFLLSADPNRDGGVYAVGFVATLVLALLGLAPWVAYRAGRLVAARAATVPVLIAGRRLVADARPAGRAAAAIGVIGVVAGAGGAVLADLPDTVGGQGFAGVEAFYTVPIVLAGAVLLAALVLVVFSMAVHGVESLIDHKRSVASLAALGASVQELERAQRWEVGLVALPMSAVGLLIGSVPMVFLTDGPDRYTWIPILVELVTIGLVWVAVVASARLTRPWLARAVAPVNLRTA